VDTLIDFATMPWRQIGAGACALLLLFEQAAG